LAAASSASKSFIHPRRLVVVAGVGGDLGLQAGQAAWHSQVFFSTMSKSFIRHQVFFSTKIHQPQMQRHSIFTST
jgi:hypothetical protein